SSFYPQRRPPPPSLSPVLPPPCLSSRPCSLHAAVDEVELATVPPPRGLHGAGSDGRRGRGSVGAWERWTSRQRLLRAEKRQPSARHGAVEPSPAAGSPPLRWSRADLAELRAGGRRGARQRRLPLSPSPTPARLPRRPRPPSLRRPAAPFTFSDRSALDLGGGLHSGGPAPPQAVSSARRADATEPTRQRVKEPAPRRAWTVASSPSRCFLVSPPSPSPSGGWDTALVHGPEPTWPLWRIAFSTASSSGPEAIRFRHAPLSGGAGTRCSWSRTGVSTRRPAPWWSPGGTA
ncbi:unnamed protein product, partial [Urochloa humidicola]